MSDMGEWSTSQWEGIAVMLKYIQSIVEESRMSCTGV